MLRRSTGRWFHGSANAPNQLVDIIAAMESKPPKHAQRSVQSAPRRARGTAETPAAARKPSTAEAQRVFETLRNAVLDQRLPPGLQLKEQPLADAFGVNRAVVRQALARLETYCLVRHEPNRGVFVARPSVAEGRDIFTARRYIEAAIVELAAARIRPRDLARLRALVRREQAAYAAGDLQGGLRLSIDFHVQLAAAAGNEVLAAFLDELVSRTPLVVLSHRKTSAPTCALSDHDRILDALEARDADLARGLMIEHVGHLEGRLALDEPAPGKDADVAVLLGLATDCQGSSAVP